MEFLSIIAIIISVIAILRSNESLSKVLKLENSLNDLNKNHSKVPASSLSENVLNNNEVNQIKTVKEKDVVVEYKESGFIKWLKEGWLLKLGGILVIMGVLFFLSVAFTNVGPQGKVAIGYMFGLALMLSGFFYAKKQIIGGSAIHLIGAVVIIITTYLARQPSYNLFDPYLATLLMFLTTVCVSLTAFLYNRSSLAHAGLLIASFIPMLTGTERGSFSFLLTYLGVVTLGVLWLALVTKWRTLVFWSLTILCMYSIMKIDGSLGTTALSLGENCLLILFGFVFYITSLFSILRSNGVTGKVDGYVALLNAGFALTWIISQASNEMAPIIIAVVGLIYAIGFFFVYKITDVYTSFVVYGGVAVGLLTTSVMLELSGRSEAVALLLIAGGLSSVTYYLSKNESITKLVSLFHMLPMLSVFYSVANISYQTGLNQGLGETWKDFLIVGLAIVIYLSLHKYFSDKIEDLSRFSLFIWVMLSVIIVWQIAHLIITGGFATFVAILLYTIAGLVVLFNGTQEKNEDKIRVAKACLGIIAARVIFWDAWQVGDIVLGVLICVVIGVLLLSSTFIIKKVATE